jgi:maleylpyruvate isomerase
MAILAWLDEAMPDPALLPSDLIVRARCRAFASVVTEDIFPVQNLGVRQKLGAEFGADVDRQAQWCADWIARGLAVLERDALKYAANAEGFLFGNGPTLAEICLVPQMRNAVRYQVDLAPFPRLVSAREAAMAHPAFINTAPETQP